MKKIVAIVLCICICLCTSVMPVSADSQIKTGKDDAVLGDDLLKYFLGFELDKDDNTLDAEEMYERSIGVSLSSATLLPNSTTAVSVSLTKNKGFSTASLFIGYDTYDIELVNAVSTTDLLSVTFTEYESYAVVNIESTQIYDYDKLLEYTALGEIVELTFSAGQVSGEYPLTFMNSSVFINTNGNVRSAEYVDGNISVSCNHSFPSEYTVIKKADCMNAGTSYRNCTICGFKEFKEIEPTGHTEGEWQVYAPATCVSMGTEALFCRDCDTVLDSRSIDMIGHSMAWAVTKQPTCFEEGEKTHLCIICGGERGETQSIAKTQHTPGKTTVLREPTCAEEGVEAVICKYCHETISTTPIEKLPHEITKLNVITAPTSENEGEGEYICVECGETTQTVTFDKVDGIIHGEDVSVYRGDTVRIPVVINYNTGFSYGVVRVSYDTENLEFLSVSAGEVTQDITIGTLSEGEISVLLCPNDEESRTSGVLFYIEFKVLEDAENTFLDIYYNPGADFCDKYGKAVFFNFEGLNIKVNKYRKGDANNDNVVDVTDLALLKLYLVGATTEIGEGANINGDGIIDVTDLAFLKLHLAGSYVLE